MIYLDNNATTALDPEVLEAMLPVLKTHYGNASSASHSLGWFAAELVQIAREQIAALINASPEEIIFTSGATESNNMAIKGFLSKDPALLSALTSNIEHRSVLEPLNYLHSEGLELNLAKVNSDGLLDNSLQDQLEELNPNFISLMLANNEIGTIQDLKLIFDRAKAMRIVTHSDATQALGKISIDVKKLGADMMSISAHKIHGPTGIVALYISKGLNDFAPLLHGGGQEQGLRSGTLNVAGIVGFGKACEVANKLLKNNSNQTKELTELFLKTLKETYPDIEINGHPEKRIPGNLNLILKGTDSAKLSASLSTKIAFSTSSSCQSDSSKPSHVLRALGLSAKDKKSSIRIGLSRLNSIQEVIEAAKLLGQEANKSEAKLSRNET